MVNLVWLLDSIWLNPIAFVNIDQIDFVKQSWNINSKIVITETYLTSRNM